MKPIKKFDYKHLASRVREQFQYGDTFRSKGKEIGISVATMSRLLQEGKIDLDTFIKVYNWLGCTSIEEFLNDKI